MQFTFKRGMTLSEVAVNYLTQNDVIAKSSNVFLTSVLLTR